MPPRAAGEGRSSEEERKSAEACSGARPLTEIVFIAAFALVSYTVAGYPLLVATLARIFPNPVCRGPCSPRVAVIVVAHREAERIGAKIESCLALDYPAGCLRLLVVLDGADVATAEAVGRFSGHGVQVLSFAERRGKAACLNDAVRACDEEVLVFSDARQRLDRAAVRALVENFADPRVGAVGGELVFETGGITSIGDGIDAYWRYEKCIRRQESLLHSSVGVSGALYAIRRECFRDIPLDTILDDLVIPMNVVMDGRRVVLDSRAKAFDLPSRDTRQEMLRKVRTIAGNYQLLAARPAFLNPMRNPIAFQLLSHKLLRIVMPLGILTMFVTSALLLSRAPIYQALFVAQLATYALPALGWLWPAARDLRIVKLPTVFMLLNWFAVLGAVEYFRNRNAHLWKAA